VHAAELGERDLAIRRAGDAKRTALAVDEERRAPVGPEVLAHDAGEAREQLGRVERRGQRARDLDQRRRRARLAREVAPVLFEPRRERGEIAVLLLQVAAVEE